MHVDGFRFDLASALARELHAVDRLSAFFDIIHQDPVISQVKLIAEPWDLGEGGYQVGNFPVGWTEWNGRYRDAVRRFWKGEAGLVPEMATRLAGSSDLYEHSGRRPYASINFITSHDGFTLEDLVGYNSKHNEANGENNADGDNNNNSWNCGEEGPSADPRVLALRQQQKRNLMATLMLSQGVPMICGGDELSRTQQGNNNAYCQDNELSWYNWELGPEKLNFLAYVRYLIYIRKSHPVLRRRRFFKGSPIADDGIKDLAWFGRNGEEMSNKAWHASSSRCLGFRLVGAGVDEPEAEGISAEHDVLFVILNAHHQALRFILPKQPEHELWERILDTSRSDWSTPLALRDHTYLLRGRCIAVFRIASKRRK
jgi:glycogen operon protein